MSTIISGDHFIKTLRSFLEVNQARFLPSTIKNNKPRKQASNSGGFFKAISSLWSTHASVTKPQPETCTFLSDIPYMPTRSTLTLDIHDLYFLLVQFEQFELEDTHLPIPEQNGIAETETATVIKPKSKAPSITSTTSLSTGWQTWSNQSQTKRPIQEDIVYIHCYLGKIQSLKVRLNVSPIRVVQGYQDACSAALPLGCFKSLTCLELCNVDPKSINSLPSSITNLVVRHIDNSTDILENRWPHIKMVSLEDTNLTALDSLDTIETITHLNLSRNLLIDTPTCLASLYNLTSLNLSHNMISQTNGINTVLGNIHELDLSGNRLSSLVGLDQLWSLEKLDVRDNQMEDVAEIGRLTALPNISHIWVEGNPFTKLQPDFRVEIFNAFKQHDITLDSSKPSSSERRRIQVTEGSTAPTVSAKVNDDQVAKLSKAKMKRQIRLGQSKQEIPIPAAAAAAASMDDDTPKFMHRLVGLEEAVQNEHAQLRKSASLKSRRSNRSNRSSKAGRRRSVAEEKFAALAGNVDTTGSTHEFRKKIETMRKEAGTEWLRVLQEMDVVKKEIGHDEI